MVDVDFFETIELYFWWYWGMALQMSALFTYKFPLCTGPLSRVTANFQGAGAKFKHFLSPGNQQFVKKHPTSLCSHFNIAPRGENFSKTAALWTPSQGSGSSVYRGRRGFLGKFALGAAAGLSIATLVQSLHTGAVTAMALKINLNSAEGDWKKIKGEAVKQNLKECSVQCFNTCHAVCMVKVEYTCGIIWPKHLLSLTFQIHLQLPANRIYTTYCIKALFNSL